MEGTKSVSPQDNNIKSLHLSCPITCLKLDSSKKFLFVCQGPKVTIFSKLSQNGIKSWMTHCLTLNDVLPACRIHGAEFLSKGDDFDQVVFFGQKKFRLGRFHRSNSYGIDGVDAVSLTLDEEAILAPDWLWELKFLRSTTQLALVTAHNQLRCYDFDKKETTYVVDAPESHILYSATIIGDTWDTLVVAAGTVFNCVILWAPKCKEIATLAGC